jgi:methionyl aminopeptidase
MIAKTAEEIAHLRTAGKMLSEVLREVAALVKPGVATSVLDLAAQKGIEARGAMSSFLGYAPEGAKYPYPTALCVSVNSEVVHGIPSEGKILKKGDAVSLDLGLSYKSFFVDAAVTICVGNADARAKKLISATRDATAAAIAAAKIGNHIGDIGVAVMRVAQKSGFAIVEDLGGHAVGGAVHEKPFVPNVGTAGEGEEIVEGLVLAIEPMLCEGSPQIILGKDDWTYLTRDGSRAAHFEHTVLVTKTGPEILTL